MSPTAEIQYLLKEHKHQSARSATRNTRCRAATAHTTPALSAWKSCDVVQRSRQAGRATGRHGARRPCRGPLGRVVRLRPKRSEFKERRMGLRGGHMARQQPGPRDVTRGPKAAGTYSRQVREVTEETCVGGQPARAFTGTPCGDAGVRAGADNSAPRAHHLNPIPRCKGWHLVGEPRCDWCSWGY